MALRAFHANPSIGGFGGESTSDILLLDPNNKEGDIGNNIPQSGDAQCQIVKELVDNAIDACQAGDQTNKHRVKVEVLPSQNNEHILQVTISDNGCGMDNIQECVNAFGSSKHGGNTNTAGRYGIGLTLCLLHAQRLVPHSYTCITSATKNARFFTRALYVVDTDGDSVRCDKKETIPKTQEDESGTCVSLLVPVSPYPLWPIGPSFSLTI
jgi:DNA topoisomerase VI subunit B